MRKNFIKAVAMLSLVMAVPVMAGCNVKSTNNTTEATTTTEATSEEDSSEDFSEDVVDDTELDITDDGFVGDGLYDDLEGADMPEGWVVGGESTTALFDAVVAAAEEKTTPMEIAEVVMGNELTKEIALNLVNVEDVKEWMPGLKAPATKYTEGALVNPFISSIPYVLYVFSTDDVDGLKAELQENMNPRWNICTEAADVLVESTGNYVVLIMCPEL